MKNINTYLVFFVAFFTVDISISNAELEKNRSQFSINKEEFALAFESIILGNVDVYGFPSNSDKSIVKWASDVRTFIWHTDEGIIEKNISDFEYIFDTIRKNTNIRILHSPRFDKKSNLMIILIKSPKEYYDAYDFLENKFGKTSSFVAIMNNIIKYNKNKINEGSYCFTKIINNAKRQIKSAAILIPAYGKYFKQCLFQQLFRAFGFVGGVVEVNNSMFSADFESISPTGIDLKILKTLYFEQVKPGMRVD